MNLRLIEITREGYYDSETLTGELTRYVATDELLEKMNELAGHPAITLKPNFFRGRICTSSQYDRWTEALN